MNNADMPAIPSQEINSSIANNEQFGGLTKREHMAVEFTKSNIIGVYSTVENGEFHDWCFEDFAREGLGQADALLAALEAKQ